jgi:hypothetical protein
MLSSYIVLNEHASNARWAEGLPHVLKVKGIGFALQRVGKHAGEVLHVEAEHKQNRASAWYLRILPQITKGKTLQNMFKLDKNALATKEGICNKAETHPSAIVSYWAEVACA